VQYNHDRQSLSNDDQKSTVFSSRRKVVSDGAFLTDDGRLFHAWAEASDHLARSLSIERLVDSTSAERRRRRVSNLQWPRLASPPDKNTASADDVSMSILAIWNTHVPKPVRRHCRQALNIWWTVPPAWLCQQSKNDVKCLRQMSGQGSQQGTRTVKNEKCDCSC